jgi:carbamoyl-phosphate synthase large subunit
MIESQPQTNQDVGANQPFSVLVTSASHKVSCLKAVREAMNRSFGPKTNGNGDCLLFAADSNPKTLGRYFADGFWTMPSLEELTTDELISFCNENQIKAIIPTRDGELAYFANQNFALMEAGISVMVSKIDAVKACDDKLLFSRILEQQQLPSIPTVQNISLMDTKSFVVKEQFGAGSKSLLLNAEKDQAQHFAKTLFHPVFQPFIEGTEYSVDLFITQNNSVKGTIVRERTLVIDGEAHVTTTLNRPDIGYLCERAALSFELTGHSVWQVLESADKNLHVIECNPRFGGASTASLAVGLDSFYWFLQETIHGSIDHIPFLRSPQNIQQIRYRDNDIAIVPDL